MEKTVGIAARIGLTLALTGLSACSMFNGSHSSQTAPPPTPSATVAPPTAPVAQVTIRDVQSALQQAGYYKNGKVDGVWGRRTEREVRRFQHDHNLTANGKLDVPTLQALNLTGTPPSTSDTNNPPSDNAPPPPAAPAPQNNNPPSDNNPPPDNQPASPR